jgi:hypothetical protein
MPSYGFKERQRCPFQVHPPEGDYLVSRHRKCAPAKYTRIDLYTMPLFDYHRLKCTMRGVWNSRQLTMQCRPEHQRCAYCYKYINNQLALYSLHSYAIVTSPAVQVQLSPATPHWCLLPRLVCTFQYELFYRFSPACIRIKFS